MAPNAEQALNSAMTSIAPSIFLTPTPAPAALAPSPITPEQAKKVMMALSGATAVFIFVIIWSLLGFIAFIMSIVCFWRSGTFGQHIIGFLIALMFGPFYWFYYKFASGYCISQ